MAKCKDCTHYLTCRQGNSNPNYCGQFMNYKNTVEVVRCQDCKKKRCEHGYLWCFKWDEQVQEDDFCSYGERRCYNEVD